MSKLVTWVILGLFLVLVPLGSWYYLKKGLEYRKTSLLELVPKDSISLNQDTLNIFHKKTTLLVKKYPGSDTIVKAISEQYKNVQGFQIVYFGSDENSFPDQYLSQYFDKYKKETFILMDTGMRIRNVYRSDIADVKKLVEHIAMVIPRPKESDIKMKQ